jgi:Trk K+ transport system NAD-binding subunit
MCAPCRADGGGGTFERPAPVRVDRVVSPFVVSGRQMASLSLRPSVVDLIDLVSSGPDQRLEEILVGRDSWLSGKRLSEIGAEHPRVRVVAIRRADDGELVTAPAADVALGPGDLAIAFGPADVLRTLR